MILSSLPHATITASIVEIGRRETLRDKNPAIVILVGVEAQMLARAGARLGGVALEDDDHARAHPFVGSHDGARLLGVRRKTHVGMRAVGFARGQAERFGMQRRDNQRRLDFRRDRLVQRRLHPRDVFAEIAEGLDVLVPAQILDQRAMAYADAEDEAIGRDFSQRLRRHGHRHRVAHPDVRDTGRVNQAVGVREHVTAMRERLASPRLGRPDDLVAHPLDPAAKRGALGRGHRIHETERTQLADFHRIAPSQLLL
jgi:hypothetical protein